MLFYDSSFYIRIIIGDKMVSIYRVKVNNRDKDAQKQIIIIIYYIFKGGLYITRCVTYHIYTNRQIIDAYTNRKNDIRVYIQYIIYLCVGINIIRVFAAWSLERSMAWPRIQFTGALAGQTGNRSTNLPRRRRIRLLQ